ncbi:hypothetical protein Tco_0103366 [Tanacetum coccineum]
MGKSYDEIQKLFDKEMKRVNTFVAMSFEAQEINENKEEGSEEKAKGSRKKMLGRKRAGKEQQQESSKKQRMEEDKETYEVEEVEEDDEYEKSFEGIMVHYELIRADGSSKRYSSMIRMIQDIDREDLLTLWKLVKTKHGDIRLEDDHERVLWGDFKVMLKRSKVWRDLQGLMQAYNATNNESPIPLPRAPIALPTVLPLSLVLSPSPLFDSQNFFLPEEILSP